jgi:glycosyltransferase involved in cell wall biosynthesis
MKKDNLVSVVIPAYNAENSIEECLRAAIFQTYRNIEIIVIDDGSDDGTFVRADSFSKKDSRIQVIRQDNSGPSAARNCGIKEAKGDYIVFWDADDYPEPDLIESYVVAYDRWVGKDISFVACGMFFDNRFNKNIDDKVSILESGLGYAEGENYIMLRSSAAMMAYLKLFNFVTNKCYSLKTIKDKVIIFDEEIKIGEDLKFNLDYLDNCPGSIGMINRPLYHYVKRTDDNLSISYHEGDMEDTKAVYRRFVEWESRQLGATADSILVVKGIFITDWVSRMTSMYEALRKTDKRFKMLRTLRQELSSKEFRKILYEVHKARKISMLRYLCLMTADFNVFYFFRWFYQRLKG